MHVIDIDMPTSREVGRSVLVAHVESDDRLKPRSIFDVDASTEPSMVRLIAPVL